MDGLLLRVEDLAKGWLLALLEQAPLEDAPAILAAELVRDGPRACEAVVRALADDADLRRLEPGGALERLVAQAELFAGAGSVDAVARAVDALGAVIWSGVRSELVDPDVDQVSELAERLALVIEVVRGAALRAWAGADVGPERPVGAEADTGAERPVGAESPRGLLASVMERSRPPAGDEVASHGPRAGDEVASQESPPASDEAPSRERPSASAERPSSLWMGALGDEIRRADTSGAPLSLLVVELDEADRMQAVEGGVGARATFGRFAQAVRSVMRRQDILACESDVRAWIIARDTSRLGAQTLGERIAGAVHAAEPWRGAPLALSVGVAVFGEDGRDVASMVDAAEESRFAAAASGVAVVRPAEPPKDQC